MQNTLVNVFLKLLDIQSPAHITCLLESGKSVSFNSILFPCHGGDGDAEFLQRMLHNCFQKFSPAPDIHSASFNALTFFILLEDVKGIYANVAKTCFSSSKSLHVLWLKTLGTAAV